MGYICYSKMPIENYLWAYDKRYQEIQHLMEPNLIFLGIWGNHKKSMSRPQCILYNVKFQLLGSADLWHKYKITTIRSVIGNGDYLSNEELSTTMEANKPHGISIFS